jgi:2'-5' RNA ligase
LSGAPPRRLFFALWPDDEQRAALVQGSGRIVRHCGGRPVPASNLHITLAFLGSVPEPRLEELSAIARRVAATYPQDAVPLTVTLEALEHWSKPQVLAVLGRQDESQGAPVSGTVELARRLTKETAAAGFSPDLKPFRVHVTVARKVARPPRTSAGQKVLWRFDAFTLIESRTLAEGPVYSVVESYLLGDSEKLRT